MTLVTGEDRVPVRVGPKVFADVPSAAEVDGMRRARNSMAVWLMLLLGILVAVIGILLFNLLVGWPQQRADLDKQLEDAQKMRTQLEQQVGELQTDIGPYRQVMEELNLFETARQEITRLPGYQQARREFPARDWEPFDRAFDWQSPARLGIQAQTTKLNALRDRVSRVRPRTGNACDPRDPNCRSGAVAPPP